MKKTQINAIKRIISNNHPYRSALCGMWTDEAGRVCACDGYRAIRFTYYERPEEIPTAEGVNLDRFFDVTRGYPLPVPSIEELKGIIKQDNERKNKLSVYDFGDNLPMVNARYLLDLLRIFPDAKIYRTENNPKNKAIFIDSAFGDGLLLPLRKE